MSWQRKCTDCKEMLTDTEHILDLESKKPCGICKSRVAYLLPSSMLFVFSDLIFQQTSCPWKRSTAVFVFKESNSSLCCYAKKDIANKNPQHWVFSDSNLPGRTSQFPSYPESFIQLLCQKCTKVPKSMQDWVSSKDEPWHNISHKYTGWKIMAQGPTPEVPHIQF